MTADPSAGHGTTIERFLGQQAATGGPFALLGLPVRKPSDQEVVEALQQRLSRVDASALCETPEADEVRLALHAAAAQLMDPTVQRHMLARWRRSARREATSGSVRSKDPRPTPDASPATSARARSVDHSDTENQQNSNGERTAEPEPVQPVVPLKSDDFAQNSLPRTISKQTLIMLEHDAILTLARHGGWNKRSLRDLAMLAHARGIGSDEVALALSKLVHRRELASPEPDEGRAQTPSHPSNGQPAIRHADSPQTNQTRRDPVGLWTAVMVVLIFAAGSAVTGVALFMPDVWRSVVGLGSAESGARDSAADGSTDSSQTSGDSQLPSDESSALRADDPAPVQDDERGPDPGTLLEHALEAASTDKDRSVRLFGQALDQIASSWTNMSHDELTAASVLLVDHLHRVARVSEGVAERAAAGLVDRARPVMSDRDASGIEVVDAVWASALLERVHAERELPGPVRSTIDAGLASMGTAPEGSGTVHSRLERALDRAIGPLSSGQAVDHTAWSRWIEGVARVESSGPGSLDGLRLRALRALMLDGPEPSAERWILDTIDSLVRSVGWSEGAPARAWLIELFDTPGASNADLAAVTGALANARRVEGLDASMRLGADATAVDRVRLRDRYAESLGVGSDASLAGFAIRWHAKLDDLVRANRSTPTDHLEGAVALARLNEAALMRWSGDAAGALEGINQVSEDAGSSAGNELVDPSILDSTVGDDWAFRYLEVGSNLSARLALLDEFASSSPRGLGPMASEVLVGEAVRGNHSRIRARAHQVVRRFVLEPNVVLGVLEILPKLPPTRSNIELVERAAGVQLPPSDDPEWMHRARRALVERGLELVAASTELSRADRLAASLGRSYAQRAHLIEPVGPESSEGDVGAAPSLEAERLRIALARSVDHGYPHPSLGFSASDVEDRRVSRLRLSSGPIGRFLAEQISVVELSGLVIAWESPDRSDRVSRVLDDLEAERRGARHIFEQVFAAERALARLWSVRLEAIE